MQSFLEDLVLEWGIKASLINKAFKDALYEAEQLGQIANKSFIKKIMSIVLERNNKVFIDRFCECKHYDLKKFIEDLFDEDLMSTDFSSDQRPENMGHKYYTAMHDITTDNNQEENNKEAEL